MKIRCIIVDDEPLALEILENYIEKIPSIELVESCRNAIEAFIALSRNSIDVMFVDVNMPDIDGISFIKQLKNPPIIILTTAYQEYALESFNLNVIDYLLKPFSLERFLQSIQKIDSLQLRPSNTQTPFDLQAISPFFFVKSERKIVKISLEKLDYIEAKNDYVMFHLIDDQKIIAHGTLKNLEETLPQIKFLRIHRSYIIAIDKIDMIVGNIVYISNKKLPIGAVYRPILERIISKNNLF